VAKRNKASYEIGFGKPPRSTQFRPGQSGNPAGRPPGAKNFATALEEALRERVVVIENGRRRRISKRDAIAKHLVNKAVGGDLKAIPLLLYETRLREATDVDPVPEQVFETPEDRNVLDSMIRRIRNADPAPLESGRSPNATQETEE
jgi:Family of unknown function (DUF5681)